jgi:hypothetical protein
MGQHPADSPPHRFLEPTDAKSKQNITDQNSRHTNEDDRLTLRTTPPVVSCSTLACLRTNSARIYTSVPNGDWSPTLSPVADVCIKQVGQSRPGEGNGSR